jgi:hypothetical protein
MEFYQYQRTLARIGRPTGVYADHNEHGNLRKEQRLGGRQGVSLRRFEIERTKEKDVLFRQFLTEMLIAAMKRME